MTRNSREEQGGLDRGSPSAHQAAGKIQPSYVDESLGRGSVAAIASSKRGTRRQDSREGEQGGGRDPQANVNVLPTQDCKNVVRSESDFDSTPCSLDGSRSSSFSASSPYSSTDGGGSAGAGSLRRGYGGGSSNGGGSSRGSNSHNKNNASSPAKGSGSFSAVGALTTEPGGGSISPASGSGGVRTTLGGSARDSSVPFGSSALSNALPNSGRGRPRGLRPRNYASTSQGGSLNRIPSFSSNATSSSRVGSVGRTGASTAPFRNGDGGGAAEDVVMEAEAQAAEIAAPGLPVGVVVRAAITIESVMRVLIARGYVRRKLVSEVTAFSLIMERGIEVIKHPFSGKAKPKNVTVNFVSRKGAMHLSWGGKSGVALETIFGVTKGIKTDALQRVVEPDRAEHCFSLHTEGRTVDFEVDNPWLVLLVVRALRLFLGAHYDTLPAPTFFSHLCVRPRGASHGALSPRQTLVWTGGPDPQKSPVKEPTSTPTERTSGDSASDDGGSSARSRRRASSAREKSPWDGGEEEDAVAGINGEVEGGGDASGSYPPPPPAGQAPGASPSPGGGGGGDPARGGDGAEQEGGVDPDFAGIDFGDEAEEEEGGPRSPGGIMALFSSGRRSSVDFSSSGGDGRGSGGAEVEGPVAVSPAKEEPLTASQLLATRGMSKRLTLSKKMSAANVPGGVLKGKRFDLMALPTDPGQQERRERGTSEHTESTKRTQGMSISIGAGYELPEEQRHRRASAETEGPYDPERMAVVDDLNDKLQSLRKLCVPQQRIGAYRPGRAPKTMAVKHMAFFQGAGGAVVKGGMGSVTDMWGDGVRRQYQTDMVRQQDQSVEDVRKRDDVRTAMLVNRSGVHRVTRKASASSETR